VADPELVAKEVSSLVARLRLWTPARWAAAADPWGTRADLGRHVAQWCADRAAELEGQRLRALPVLTPDLLVADQVAVAGDDLVRALPPAQLCADAVAHLLVHRYDLLAEEPPASLGGAAALRRGRAVCQRSVT
jgi:hypothetical protein